MQLNTKTISVLAVGIIALVVIAMAMVGIATGHLTNPSDPIQAEIALSQDDTGFIVLDEGVGVAVDPATIDFRGAGVEATGVGRFVTVTSAGSVAAAGSLHSVAIEGDVLVITYTDLGGTEQMVRFTGVEQPLVFQRRATRHNTVPFTATDFLDSEGSTAMTDTIGVGGGGQDIYLAFWQPDIELELTVLRPALDMNNHIDLFEPPLPLVIDSVSGYYWRSTAPIVATLLGQDWVMRSPGAVFPPFPRYIAYSTDTTVVASDFTNPTTGGVSYHDEISFPSTVTRPDAGSLMVAVPNDQPDVTDVCLSQDAITYHCGAGYSPQPLPNVTINGVQYKVWRSNRSDLILSSAFFSFFRVIQPAPPQDGT